MAEEEKFDPEKSGFVPEMVDAQLAFDELWYYQDLQGDDLMLAVSALKKETWVDIAGAAEDGEPWEFAVICAWWVLQKEAEILDGLNGNPAHRRELKRQTTRPEVDHEIMWGQWYEQQVRKQTPRFIWWRQAAKNGGVSAERDKNWGIEWDEEGYPK